MEEIRRDIAVICLPRQIGKSFMLVAYCIAFCIANPGVIVLFAAPTKEQVDEIVMPHINNVFSYLPEHLIPIKKGRNWRFPHNGSLFRIAGVNIGGGQRLRGTALHLCVIDECREIPQLEQIIDNVINPMFTTTHGRLILISTPPESPLHPFTDKYIREAKERSDFFSCTYKDNPLIRTEELRSWGVTKYLGMETNAAFRREQIADYSVADPEKKVVREWNVAANDLFFETYKGPISGGRAIPVRPYTFMDYGHTDPCGILFGYYNSHEGVLIIEDEHLERGLRTDRLAEIIKEKEAAVYGMLPGQVQPIRIMDLDPALMGDLGQTYGLRFMPARKTPNNSYMLNQLRVAFIDQKIRVHPRCTNLRFQLEAGVFNSKNTDYLKTTRGGHLDLVDALKYGNLSIDWREILTSEVVLGPNQIRWGGIKGSSPFGNATSFAAGVLQRPQK